jgi:hypothetical protein
VPTVIVPAEIADELRARAFGIIQAYLRDDVQAAETLLGDDQDAAVLLPVLLGLLVEAVALLLGEGDPVVGRASLADQVGQWLNERRNRLAGA